MKKAILLNRNNLLAGIGIWWLVFVVLSLARQNDFQVLNIIGFSFLSLVPGLLTLFALRLKAPAPFVFLMTSAALSLLELMLIGLLSNTILPFVGITRPLDRNALIVEISIFLIIIARAAWRGASGWRCDIRETIHKYFSAPKDIWLTLLPLLFVAQSVLGTTILNNGGNGWLTMTMLVEMALYFLVIIHYRDKIEENTILMGLFFSALSLLFMTSLRGWYVTGHDIQTEYKVFELTKNAGVWDIFSYQDAYNACLSITILPTIFYNLLKVSDPYIYKCLFQIFFAFCPGIAYLISRNWTNRPTAIIAGIYFMAFPTFFSDMPFFVRQEISFFFYGIMIWIIFKKGVRMQTRRMLFLIMGLGMILSHYSTTYTTLAILGISAISLPLLRMILIFLKNRTSTKPISPSIPIKRKFILNNRINIFLVIILISTSLIWTFIVTKTGSGLSGVVQKTIEAIRDESANQGRSVDALSLLSFSRVSKEQALQDYIKNVADPMINQAPKDYFTPQQYDKYRISTTEEERLPINAFGNFVRSLGIDVIAVFSIFGQILAKLMIVMAPVGLLYILLRKSTTKFSYEYNTIVFFSLAFIAMNIFLPVLSAEYGVYRAMEQSMFILAPVITIGSIAVGKILGSYLEKIFRFFRIAIPAKLRSRDNSYLFPSALAICFFLHVTAVTPQLFGGNVGVLHLNNMGEYYDSYMTHTQEIECINWMKTSISKESLENSGIQADRFSQIRITSLTDMYADDGIVPEMVRKDSYVFLSTENIIKQKATIAYNGDPITYSSPLQFFEENKDLIYDNGKARVYK